MSEVTAKIRSRGYWDVSIRPNQFNERRVDYADLDQVLDSVVVRLRGWPVPYIDHRELPMHGDDWIGQGIDAGTFWHSEAWRFFASGQFTHLRAVSADWRTGREATPTPEGFASVIEVWEIVYYVTEVFELAARLSLSAAGDDEMIIDIALNGTEGRALVVAQLGRMSFSQPYRASAEVLKQSVTLPRDQLVAETREKAIETAREFFLRFGWKASVELLTGYQLELTKNS